MARGIVLHVGHVAGVPLEIGALAPVSLEVGQGGGPPLPAYSGPYTVIPEAWFEQVLPTAGKRMTQDLVVNEIPYLLAGNEAGGYTATIGG